MTISLKVINIKITKKGITLKLELGIPFDISKSGLLTTLANNIIIFNEFCQKDYGR